MAPRREDDLVLPWPEMGTLQDGARCNAAPGGYVATESPGAGFGAPGICPFDLSRWTNVVGWVQRVTELVGLKAPFDLLAMEDADVSSNNSEFGDLIEIQRSCSHELPAQYNLGRDECEC